jgi:hypothetical protein
MNLKTLDHFTFSGKKGDDISDSIIFASNLPGYGTPLCALLKIKNQNKEIDKNEILNQALFTAYSFFDEIDSIKQLMYETHTFKGNNISNRSSEKIQVAGQLAVEKVIDEAKMHSVIMINESHYDWRHRYFVQQLLDSLYKIGYHFLCLEALKNPDSINQRKFRTDQDGYYLKEPFMCNLARKALKIGYQLIAYEDTIDNVENSFFNSPIDKREYYQALNLYRQYKKDTSAKWLILAGYSHINKYRFNAIEPSTMAKYFFELSKVMPYTINQTVYCDLFNIEVPIDSNSKIENYYYLRNDQINNDSLLLKQSDLYVINNIHTIPYEDINSIDDRTEYKIKYEPDNNTGLGYIIKVFLRNEYLLNQNAIPIYINKAFEKNYEKTIWLSKDQYYLIVTDLKDRILFQGQLSN